MAGDPILDYQEEHTDQFVVFRKFNDEEYANEIGSAFKDSKIDYIISETTTPAPLLTNSEPIKEFTIKLRKGDFNKAENIIIGISKKQIEGIDSDYHLFQFTDEELMEVIFKSDEWSPLDLVLAQKILKERGKEIDIIQTSKLKQERLVELSKPDKSETLWIVLGYIFSLFGGILAIIIEWLLLSQKKTLPNGVRVYANSPSDRKHGNRIFLLGISCFILWTIWNFVK